MEASTLLTGRFICFWRFDVDHVPHALVRARSRGSQKDQRLFQRLPGRAGQPFPGRYRGLLCLDPTPTEYSRAGPTSINHPALTTGPAGYAFLPDARNVA